MSDTLQQAEAEPRFELAFVEDVIENELAQGCTQKDIALTYAMGMASTWKTDWGRVNRAIMAKWPKGLERVKKMAWALLEAKVRQMPSPK